MMNMKSSGLTEEDWNNLYDNIMYLQDACLAREEEEVEMFKSIFPLPRVAIFWRADGIFFQLISEEGKMIFKLNRDGTWGVFGTGTTKPNKAPDLLDDAVVIYDGPLYRRILR